MVSEDIKNIGIKCYNCHVKREKDKRNEYLIELKNRIAEKLGEDYIRASIVNTPVYCSDEGGIMFPTIKFSVAKSNDESTWAFAYRMMDVFEIKTMPFVDAYDGGATVILDITEYWKNAILDDTILKQYVSPELIDLCGELQFEQWTEWSKSISEMLSDCDITMQKVIEAYDNGKEMSGVLQEQWNSIGKLTKLLIKWNNLWSKSYNDLSDEDKRIYKDYALKLMNLYINWHFANIINV